jgi:hypothetical protein
LFWLNRIDSAKLPGNILCLSISRTVIDHDHFIRRMLKPSDAFEALPQEGCAVSSAHDYRGRQE